MYCNLFDSHLHTEHSPDGHDSVQNMAGAALDRGLAGIAVTDHCELDDFEGGGYADRLSRSADDVLAARAALSGRLHISLGIEMAQADYGWEKARQIVEGRPYDLVLASVHRSNAFQGHLYLFDYAGLGKEGVRRLMEDYFCTMREFAGRGNYDVLAHLSFPLRSALRNSGVHIPLEEYREQIEEILVLLRDRGKGLEVNVSGLRSPLGETMPPLWIVRRFRELGGEIVTLGSDAHCCRDLGSGLGEGMALLEEAGFRYFSFFRARKPVLLRIL